MASILVFDSGVGGLTVQQHIRHVLPHAVIHYLADNARFPYGELPEPILVAGCVDLIQRFMAKQAQAKAAIDLVVIACNSASTLVLEPLRQVLSVPVVGVVPAIKPAAQQSHHGVIGLLATPGTVRRAYTNTLIRQYATNCQVLRLGSSELVVMAEQRLSGQECNIAQLRQLLLPYTQAPIPPDVVVLGCTHFPLIAQEIQQVLGEKVQLVDSGAAIARRVETLLSDGVKKSDASQISTYYHTGAQPNMALVAALQQYQLPQVQLFD
ncbi:MAG: glutamate racemase [Ferrimonas sp.]